MVSEFLLLFFCTDIYLQSQWTRVGDVRRGGGGRPIRTIVVVVASEGCCLKLGVVVAGTRFHDIVLMVVLGLLVELGQGVVKASYVHLLISGHSSWIVVSISDDAHLLLTVVIAASRRRRIDKAVGRRCGRKEAVLLHNELFQLGRW